MRLDEVVQNGGCRKATQEVLDKHGGLWFDDETFRRVTAAISRETRP